MTAPRVDRDERTVSVENAGYRLSYHLLSFGLLGVVAYRSFALNQSSWDLLGLIVLSGAVNVVYQGSRRVLHARWVVLAIATSLLAALLAIVLVLFRAAP